MSRNRWIALIAVLWLAGTVALVWRQAWVQRQNTTRIERLERENADLRARFSALREAAAPKVPEPEHASAQGRARLPAVPHPVSPSQEQATETRKADLSQANETIEQLEARIADLQVQVQQLGSDNKRLSAAEAEAAENLSSANRAIQAQERELNGKGSHIAELELANKKLRDQGTTVAQKLAQLDRLTAELRDVHRRREGVLSAILRRYRELTEQYRALSGVLDSRAQSSPVPAGPDLARIQNVISLAEDDLRQLKSLDAEAALIQKKMAAVR